jgi:hypothetical protein
VPIKHTFADPKKASKAAQISGKLNRRMRGVIVERKNDHR